MRHLAALGVAAVLTCVACDSSPTASGAAATSPDLARSGIALAFDANAHPYGASMTQWDERWWQWEVSSPTARNPSLDPTGANCASGQSGPVWYLGVVFGTATVTRSCTVPSDRAILVNLSGVLNDYPCPDPNFQPAAGQSLQDFLTQGARDVVGIVNSLTLTVDGVSIPDLFGRLDVTPLFDFTADPSLATSIDPCITGSSQQAVAASFLAMLKPLPVGTHTIVFTARDTHGTQTSLTYDLNVAGRP